MAAPLAVAAPKPTDTNAKETPADKGAPATTTPATEKGGIAPAPPVRKAPRSTAARGGNSFKPNPDAKWSCEKTSASAEPVWRNSGSSVDFAFKIHNDGTAPLQIRAKGG
ncbi:MAG: hypothetical protein H6817_02760 [Phycisphaerales bacterium]|nr:hypothetical protein [Phycisphaerales bacterium]